MYKILNKIESPKDIKSLDKADLTRLTAEIREFLLTSVSKTGGHLSSNLGIVELSVALHRVFDSPQDKMIFDVGHQAYVHKILTGRKDDFETLRQYNGLSGFQKRYESEHDCFEAGHSSTSISVALGFAKARALKKENFNVVAVIGDGSLTGGMAFEAMNHAGHTKDKIIVVLNDNEMSISENVGGLSRYLDKLRTTTTYFRLKDDAQNMLKTVPVVGKPLIGGIKRLKGSIKHFFVPGILFEDLGFTYIGPIDGHNLNELQDAFERAKLVKGPVLVHVVTKKGRGYVPAENNPDVYHSVGTFDLREGVLSKAGSSFSDAFGEKLVALAEKDPAIVAVTAAMPSGTGLGGFKERFPERYIDVGIAEQHAVTLCAGMASQGIKPVFAVYSTFLQRAYDQILHDICIQNLPVILAIDRAGIVGQDGETHHGVFDIAYLKHIPNMSLYAPKDGDELKAMLEHALTKSVGPVAIRYPRGSAGLMNGLLEETEGQLEAHFNPDQPEAIRTTGEKQVLILSAGNMTASSVKAAKALDEKGLKVDVINMRRLSPLDPAKILEITEGYEWVFTVEDGVISGGFGESVLAILNGPRPKTRLVTPIVVNLGYPTTFIEHGEVGKLLEVYRLDAKGIEAQISQEMKR